MQMLALVFNVGVELFIIISAFCFGLQGNIDSPIEWYKKRVKRIFPPYECFLIILAVVYIVRGRTFLFANWLTCVFGVQGANVGVLGAEQTWFITALLIGYLLTPLLSEILKKIFVRKKNVIITVILLLVMPCVLTLFPSVSIFTIGQQVCFYCIAYIMGRTYYKWNTIIKPSMFYAVLLALSFAIRLVGRFLWDGSRLYDCIIVGYTQYAAALCLFLLFWSFLNMKEPGRIVRWVCNISFEIYLYHYMLIVGPISLMGITSNWLINSILVLLVTAVVASLFHGFVMFAQEKCRCCLTDSGKE